MEELSLAPEGDPVRLSHQTSEEAAADISLALDNLGVFDEQTSQEPIAVLPSGIDRFVSPSESDFKLLLEDLASHLKEGDGEMLLDVGDTLNANEAANVLSKESLDRSIATIGLMADKVNARISVVNRVVSEKGLGEACTLLVRRQVSEDDFIEVRVAVVGNVDAGTT